MVSVNNACDGDPVLGLGRAGAIHVFRLGGQRAFVTAFERVQDESA